MEKESRRHVAMEQPLAVTCLHLYLAPTSAIFGIQLCRFCLVIHFSSSPPQRQLTSKFEGFPSQILFVLS